MPDSNKVSRRTVLASGGVTAIGATVLLAGCSAASTKSTGAPASSPAPADSTAAGPTSGPASSSPPSASPAPAGGTAVAKLSDIPVGGSVGAQLDGKDIVLAQPTAGTVVGFSAICTHQGCTVKAAGKQFDCPCHGSQYDAATGNVLRGPAPSPLAKLTVTLSGNSVLAKA